MGILAAFFIAHAMTLVASIKLYTTQSHYQSVKVGTIITAMAMGLFMMFALAANAVSTSAFPYIVFVMVVMQLVISITLAVNIFVIDKAIEKNWKIMKWVTVWFGAIVAFGSAFFAIRASKE